ncbi:hypothetical protein GCM10023213_19740 [Prosthecobacter algae]|uniref:Uncharacterized protein n=1 Tax=Prosthecobacter algae TaxID=1144682 RepID=A0ABP9P201_9BACT
MPLDEQLERECARAVEAEVTMREHVRRMEELYPKALVVTMAIRHSMIEMLSFVNAIRNGLGAKRMVGEASQGVAQKSVEDTPLFAALPMSARGSSETLATAQDWKEIWTGDRIAKVPDPKKVEASLHRAGDHTQDREEGEV